MGHYGSEMMSDSEYEAGKALRSKKSELSREGAKALRDIFGEKAEAVAYFIADIAKRSYGDVDPDRVAEAFERALPKNETKTRKPRP